jgi:hypothetical protein
VADVPLYPQQPVMALPAMQPAGTPWWLPQGRYLACGKLCQALRPAEHGYRVSQHGQGLRPSCLAPLLRTAKGLAEHREVGLAGFGQCVHSAWQRRCPMGTERPTVGQGRAWEARCRALLNQPGPWADQAGPLARRWERAGEALWGWRPVQGVETTKTIAEGAHRCGVLGRKGSQGTCRAQGHRWVERVLAWRHTGRIRGRPTLPRLVEAVTGRFKGERPARSGLTQHESSPLPSTP